MAVAYVSDVENLDNTLAASTLTLSSVVGSGGDLLIAFTTWRRNSAQTCSGATYNGAAMTRIGSDLEGEGGLAAFYTIAPAGTANVVFTYSANALSQGTGIVFSGAHQSAPIGTTASTSPVAGTSTATGAVTSAADGLCVDCLYLRTSSAGLAADGAQTQRSAQDSAGTIFHRTSTEPGAASVTMSWSWTNSNQYAHLVIPISAAAAAATAKRLLLMGVG